MEFYDNQLDCGEMIEFCKEVYFFNNKQSDRPSLINRMKNNEKGVRKHDHSISPRKTNVFVNKKMNYYQRNIERMFILNQTIELNEKDFYLGAKFPMAKN